MWSLKKSRKKNESQPTVTLDTEKNRNNNRNLLRGPCFWGETYHMMNKNLSSEVKNPEKK